MLRYLGHKSWRYPMFTLCNRYFSAIGPPKNILYMNSLGSEKEDKEIYEELNSLVPQITTNVKYDVCSFKSDDKPENPNQQEWNWYYNNTIMKTIRWARFYKYDGVIIGDVSCVPMKVLLDTHNVSDFENIRVTSLGEASCIIAKNAGTTFSMVIGYKHVIPLFTENLIKYGFEDSFKAFHVLFDGDMNEVKGFPWDKQAVAKQTQEAIRKDKCGAVVLAACCDLETCGIIQAKFPKIPIIYPEIAAMKYCELLIDNHRNQAQAVASKTDMEDYNDVLFEKCPVGNVIGNTNIDNKIRTKQ
eukprot:67860_1